VFSIFKQEPKGKNKQSKIFLGFSNSSNKAKREKQTKAKRRSKPKRNNRNIFGLFVFLESKSKEERKLKRE
jgi:hypothetical protein